MPIRYYLDADCVPRQELGGEGLLTLVARLEMASQIAATFREAGITDPGAMTFTEQRSTAPGETSERELSVQDILNEAEPLQGLADHCLTCPAALDGTPFSCHKAVELPISAIGEKWLLDRLALAGTRSFALFAKELRENDYGSAPIIANWRKARFLQAREPYKAPRGPLTVTTDALLHQLLLDGDHVPERALQILLQYEALRAEDGDNGEDFAARLERLEEEGDTRIDFAIEPGNDDDETTRELKQMLFALYRAFALHVPLAVRT